MSGALGMEGRDRFGFLHIDLNSFFASVEQELHPEYRGRATAVVGTMADTGTIIAASYEAKALGIKTGTKVGEAKAICPEIVLVNGSHTVYSEFSHKIAAAVERCCPVAHTPSIDEMVCQLIGREQEPPRARTIALAIKQAIRDDVGSTLRCSIGMAPNRYLAKIASDMQKPDGLIGLLPSQLPRAIAHLELRDLPGVGARTEARLQRKGIRTMAELLALDRKGMHGLWDSVWGDRLYHWLRGEMTGDDGAPVTMGGQKSLGHSHVMGPEHRSDEGAWAVAHKLLHKAAMRLRMEKYYAGVMGVTIKYALTREQVEARRLAEAGGGGDAGGYGFGGQGVGGQGFGRATGAGLGDLGREADPYGMTTKGRVGAGQGAGATGQTGHKGGRVRKLTQHTSGIQHTGWGMEARFRDAQDTLTLLGVLRGIWEKRPAGAEFARPFYVGVVLRELIPESERQAELFAEPGNRADLSKTMDKLNLKFGHTTVHFAGMLPARESAPTRIAFTQIPVQYGVEYM